MLATNVIVMDGRHRLRGWIGSTLAPLPARLAVASSPMEFRARLAEGPFPVVLADATLAEDDLMTLVDEAIGALAIVAVAGTGLSSETADRLGERGVLLLPDLDHLDLRGVVARLVALSQDHMAATG